ncbi:hypothetical protein DB282_25925 [Escherichia coli]|nr:hypothetical protein DB282_25925 [Escherichia coli]
MFHTIVSIKNDGHYFCRAGGNRPDGLNEPVTNEQQVQFLLKSNPRRNRAKFTISPFPALRVKQHKAVLLDELKSAREQQKRRDERADGSVPLKLSGKIHKQLESIARSRGVPPKKMLNEMIEQAHLDFVANEQHKTRS